MSVMDKYLLTQSKKSSQLNWPRATVWQRREDRVFWKGNQRRLSGGGEFKLILERGTGLVDVGKQSRVPSI